MSGTLELYAALYRMNTARAEKMQAQILLAAVASRVAAADGGDIEWATLSELVAAHERAGGVAERTVFQRLRHDGPFMHYAVEQRGVIFCDDVKMVRLDVYREYWSRRGRGAGEKMFSDEDIRAVFDVWRMR